MPLSTLSYDNNPKIMAKNSYIRDNVIKNIIILIIAAIFYPIFSNKLSTITAEAMNNFLLVISILLVTVSFADFAFTYEKSKLQTVKGRILSHSTTFIFVLLTALLLEVMVLAVKTVYPAFYGMIFGFSVLLYIGIVLYDFWDLFRNEQ